MLSQRLIASSLRAHFPLVFVKGEEDENEQSAQQQYAASIEGEIIAQFPQLAAPALDSDEMNAWRSMLNSQSHNEASKDSALTDDIVVWIGAVCVFFEVATGQMSLFFVGSLSLCHCVQIRLTAPKSSPRALSTRSRFSSASPSAVAPWPVSCIAPLHSRPIVCYDLYMLIVFPLFRGAVWRVKSVF